MKDLTPSKILAKLLKKTTRPNIMTLNRYLCISI